MLPFEAIEVMGRERREALAAEAHHHRLTSSARARARGQLLSRMSGWWLALRPSRRARDRQVGWDRPVMRPARRTT
jgi:hypothetical protein